MAATIKAFGEDEVVKLLETYIRAAREHHCGHVAIAMSGKPNIHAFDYAGDDQLEPLTFAALNGVSGKLEKSIKNWAPPESNPLLDASYVCYSIANGPIGFDFLTWLVDAEMTRVREGAPAPLKVAFWKGADEAERMEKSGRKQWLEKVFLPLMQMFGAVEDYKALLGRQTTHYLTKEIVAAAKAGENVPRLKSGKDAPYHGAVTITLREKSADVNNRNSNVQEWLKFARILRERGERVIFVRDTEQAHTPLEDFETCPEASLDLIERVSLYENAKLNLFVANGPAMLGAFSDFPFLLFMRADSDHCMTDAFWDSAMGIPLGEQFPWLKANQKMIWAEDTCDKLLEAYTKEVNCP